VTIVPIVVAVIGGLAVAMVVTPLVIWFSRYHTLYDRQDDRKIHQQTISRLGGVGLVLGMVAGIVAGVTAGKLFIPTRDLVGVGLGLMPILVVSLWDDLKGISWWIRFVVQAVSASVFAVLVNPLIRLNLPVVGSFTLGVWSYPIVTGWLLLTTNAMNFIDGLDGLAAGIAAIAGSVLVASAYLAGHYVTTVAVAALVGACLGFLRYNFNPARIFMGDTGSTFLGFVLGVASLLGAGKNVAFVSLLVPILALGVPIVDALGTVVRRSYRRVNIFEPDRQHVHHLLLFSLGLSYRSTVVFLYLVSALLGGLALFLSGGPRFSAFFIAILATACVLLLLRRKGG